MKNNPGESNENHFGQAQQRSAHAVAQQSPTSLYSLWPVRLSQPNAHTHFLFFAVDVVADTCSCGGRPCLGRCSGAVPCAIGVAATTAATNRIASSDKFSSPPCLANQIGGNHGK